MFACVCLCVCLCVYASHVANFSAPENYMVINVESNQRTTSLGYSIATVWNCKAVNQNENNNCKMNILCNKPCVCIVCLSLHMHTHIENIYRFINEHHRFAIYTIRLLLSCDSRHSRQCFMRSERVVMFPVHQNNLSLLIIILPLVTWNIKTPPTHTHTIHSYRVQTKHAHFYHCTILINQQSQYTRTSVDPEPSQCQ